MTQTDVASEHAALLRLIAAGGALAPRRRLLERFATPVAACQAGGQAWRECGLGDAAVSALSSDPINQAYARSRAWLAQPQHHLIGWHDPDYPALLRQAANPPLALFLAGEPAALWHPGVAVVGSRAPTAGGRDNAIDFTRALVGSGLSIISGLAAGIDTAAHEGALVAGGRTVAVLGTGPDIAYPQRNATLHGRIAATDGCAVVSEHPPGTAPRREHFPSRNRLLAGLALGTLVVEAAERSGALITARLAAEAGREVFAVPGSIHNPLARGCHRLIRDGASLVEHAQEVIGALAPLAGNLAEALRRRLHDPIALAAGGVSASADGGDPPDPDYQRLWQAMGHDPTGMDRLVERSGLTTAELSSMLLVMELEGRVVSEHGRYSRKR